MGSVVVVGRLKALDGREQDLEQLIDEFVSTVAEKDPATHSFGFYRDGDEYVAVEVYQDSDAALAHLSNVEHLFAPLGELLDPNGGAPLQVYGDPAPELRERYAGFAPEFREPIAAT